MRKARIVFLCFNAKMIPLFWQSVTGTLETNETPRETAIREVWEEVGLKIEENSTVLFDCKESIEFEIFPHFRYKYAPNVTHCHEHWFFIGS